MGGLQRKRRPLHLFALELDVQAVHALFLRGQRQLKLGVDLANRHGHGHSLPVWARRVRRDVRLAQRKRLPVCAHASQHGGAPLAGAHFRRQGECGRIGVDVVDEGTVLHYQLHLALAVCAGARAEEVRQGGKDRVPPTLGGLKRGAEDTKVFSKLIDFHRLILAFRASNRHASVQLPHGGQGHVAVGKGVRHKRKHQQHKQGPHVAQAAQHQQQEQRQGHDTQRHNAPRHQAHLAGAGGALKEALVGAARVHLHPEAVRHHSSQSGLIQTNCHGNPPNGET
mmetsp:Transcript_10172/g.25499  ORF Transcript_10172/g.25499 Transcript_10172/m.25499 type:complete len:282 (+) Transcript_10172:2258-3103(+)